LDVLVEVERVVGVVPALEVDQPRKLARRVRPPHAFLTFVA